MSDATLHRVSYSPETVYGVTDSNPSWQRLRKTGVTLGLSKEILISAEMREDRQIADIRHGNRQGGGDTSHELSYATLDDLLEACLCGTWATKATISAETTISAAAADDSFNDSANGFVTAGFEVGDYITTSGFTGSVANNDTWKIATVAAGKITVTNPDGTAATTIVDDAAGEAVTIETTSEVLEQGTTRRSFSILREFTDVGGSDGAFHRFVGAEISGLSFTLQAGQIITVSFTFIAANKIISDTAPSGSTYSSSNSNQTMDSFDGSLLEAGASYGFMTELTLAVNNGLAPRFVAFSDTTLEPSIQRLDLTGQLTSFFDNSDLIQKFVDGTESSLKLTINDDAGNAYKITIPRIKYNGGQPDASGQGPITIAMPFQSARDNTTGRTIRIERAPVTV